MNDLSTLIRTALFRHGDATDAEVADHICEGLSDFDLRRFAHMLLCQRIKLMRKPPVVRVSSPKPKSKPATPVADRAAWMNELILIPGKLSVTWGEATVADHLARIEYLKNLCAANEAQIRKHQKAIDVIRRSHVKCLADVKVRAA